MNRARIRAGVRAAVPAVAILGVLALQSALPVTPAAAEAQTASVVNNDPSFLQVYDNNVENLETVDAVECPGDWQDLVYYMKGYETSPDLFLVQQISNRAELNVMVDKMTAELAGVYAGILAVPDPEIFRGSPCGTEKQQQTNAVIYRVGRFDVVGTRTWQSNRLTSSGCVNNTQDRTVNLAVRLRDTVADRYVTAASIHWPTGNAEGPPCAADNAREAADVMAASGGALQIWGGDANVSDQQSDGGWRRWYEITNGDIGGNLGYRDVMYDHCRESGTAIRPCLADVNWTISAGHRIDFIFARKGGGGMPFTGAEHTVTFDEGDQADLRFTGSDDTSKSYSDHRAVRARIHY